MLYTQIYLYFFSTALNLKSNILIPAITSNNNNIEYEHKTRMDIKNVSCLDKLEAAPLPTHLQLKPIFI